MHYLFYEFTINFGENIGDAKFTFECGHVVIRQS